jgi:hypothetical protein
LFFSGSDFFGFLRISAFGFSEDQIIRAFQQYKDAKPWRLSIAYSIRGVKPSIFGILVSTSGFSFMVFLAKPRRACITGLRVSM